jgi:adenylate cyclase
MSTDTPQPPPTGIRKLAAILAADVAGYSRLMAEDDQATVTALKQARAVFRESIEAHSGRLIDTAGDSVLAEFRSVVEAVQCAVEVQEKLKAINEPVAEERRMLFRIGVNQGDVIEEEDGTIYGDGVNVAARLEGLAEPGTVNVSGKVFDEVEDRLDVGFVDIGEHEVKNIAKPVRAYRVVPEGADPDNATGSRPLLLRPTIMAGLAGALVVVAGLLAWQFVGPAFLRPLDDAGLTVAEGPSIAVLPFDNLSGDPEHEYFADGLTEELITALSRFQDMKVIARHSTLRYKGSAVDVRAVATDLGVRYVVEGSVRRGADNVRVTIQLLDGGDGTHIWSDTYDRTLSAANLFAIQDEVTAKIVGRVAGRYGVLNKDDVVASRAVPTDSLSAYECVLRSYAFLEVLTSEEHAATRDCLERAVASDPKYAEAWTWLGNRAAEEYALGFNPRPNSAERALEANRRALELDSENQAVRYGMAWTLFFFGDLDAFVAEADIAVSLNPNNALVLADLGNMLRFAGQRDRGMAMMMKAIELNPHHPGWYWLNIANDSFVHGHFADAVKYVKQSKMPDYMSSLLTLAAAYGELGEIRLAGETIAKIRSVSPGYTIEDFHERARRWRYPVEYAERYVRGLTKAGLPLSPPDVSRPVIAVLPFDNLSGDPEQEYFADGITEDIITRLAQYPDILVLGRNTTFQFKGEAVDIPTIAEKLGADYVVEGSIRRGGDTVRVTAQLLGGDEWGHLWAETYDRHLDPENIFEVQDEITKRVASRIGDPYGRVNRAEYILSDRRIPRYLSTYDCSLRYFEYLRLLSSEHHKAARDCLESALEIEPDYAEGLVYLADLYLDEVGLGYNATTVEAVDMALAHAQRAAEIDGKNGQVRVRLARALYMVNQTRRARAEVEEALQLAPNNADVLVFAADVFAGVGAYDRTAEVIDAVENLNPNYPAWLNWKMAIVHFTRNEYEDAVARLEKSQSDWWFWTFATIASAQCASGDFEHGQGYLETALEMKPDFASVYWPELYFWHRGSDVRPYLDNISAGLEACGWDVPPDPGPEAFAQ